MSIIVKEVLVGKKKGFGCTDGNKWYTFAFTTQSRAQSLINRRFKTEDVIKVNVRHDAPTRVIE